MPIFAILLLLLSVWFFDIWPFYSGHFRPLAREHDYDVLFYHPDNSEEYLGEVSNIGNCRYRTREFAKKKEIEAGRWTYRCCRILRVNRCSKVEM